MASDCCYLQIKDQIKQNQKFVLTTNNFFEPEPELNH